MERICTTIEQSKKLVELGLDVNTADMYYPYLGDNQYGETARIGQGMKYSGKEDIPAWSLSALLGLMPIVNDNTYTMCGTIDGGALISHEELTCVMFHENNPLDAAFEMICWLKENNKI